MLGFISRLYSWLRFITAKDTEKKHKEEGVFSWVSALAWWSFLFEVTEDVLFLWWWAAGMYVSCWPRKDHYWLRIWGFHVACYGGRTFMYIMQPASHSNCKVDPSIVIPPISPSINYTLSVLLCLQNNPNKLSWRNSSFQVYIKSVTNIK